MEFQDEKSTSPCFPAIGDMILGQPDNIVHEILTRLDYTDLVRTSVLSKQWRYLWITSSRQLIFDHKFFRTSISKSETRQTLVEKALGIRSRTSSSSCVSLENLVLSDLSLESLSEITCLDNCIRYAIACHVKRLELRAWQIIGQQLYLDLPKGSDQYYVLPPTLFGHTGLVELFLSGCMLRSSSFPSHNNNSNNITSLPCLKLLHIWNALLDSAKLLEDLIASCPLLEDLALVNCYGHAEVLTLVTCFEHTGDDATYCFKHPDVLKIAASVNNPKLVKVKIQACTFGTVEIDAPGIQSFIFGQDMHIHQGRPSPHIVMSSCKYLRKLALYNVDTLSAFTHNWFSDLSSTLLHLVELVLWNCSMKTIKISSSSLKRLKLDSCDRLVKVEIDDPNLTSFSYMGMNMIYFASNALDLSVDITLHSITKDPNTAWFTDFVEFVGRFNTATALELIINSYKSVIVPRELRASLLPPLYNVEHLVVDMVGRQSLTQKIDEILDGLLWLSTHPVTISFASSGKKTLELTFFYDEIDRERFCCNCFSSHLTCWLHCLKEVKIKNLGMVEDEVEKNIKSFFEHAISLRKFEDLLV